MIYMGKRSVDIRERTKKAKNMQLFRVPIFLPLMVLTCWAVLDGVYGTCSATEKCINKGTCETSTCNCTNTGYKGDKCEIDINECTTTGTNKHDCDDHANCANNNGSYTCQCRSGYTGDGKTCSAGGTATISAYLLALTVVTFFLIQ